MAGQIETALGTGNVTISTETVGGNTGNTPSTAGAYESEGDGDITVSDPIGWASDNRLTLRSDNNIAVNADITAADGLVTFNSPSEVYIGGKYIELGLGSAVQVWGIESAGQFGNIFNPDGSVFYGRQAGRGIGMIGNADGFGTGTDLIVDYLERSVFVGELIREQFVFGFKNTPGASTTAGRNVTDTITNISDGDTLKLRTVSTVDGKLKATQTHTLGINDKYFITDVTLENISGSTIYDVGFARSMDPANTSDIGGSTEPVRKIEQTLGEGDTASAISATSLAGDAYATASGGKRAKLVYYTI